MDRTEVTRAMYYDVHTHNAAKQQGVVSLTSYYDVQQVPATGWCTAGIHPWYIAGADQQLLARVVRQPNVLAVGECGLDKVRGAGWQQQVDAFRFQVLLANECGKPLIIHCVRAFTEVMDVLAKCGNQVPVVFHGFRNGWHIAEKLLQKGFCLSFGAAILQPGGQAAGVLAAMPEGSWLLETDDASTAIQALYTQAAAVRNIGHENVILQLERNFNTVFIR